MDVWFSLELFALQICSVNHYHRIYVWYQRIRFFKNKINFSILLFKRKCCLLFLYEENLWELHSFFYIKIQFCSLQLTLIPILYRETFEKIRWKTLACLSQNLIIIRFLAEGFCKKLKICNWYHTTPKIFFSNLHLLMAHYYMVPYMWLDPITTSWSHLKLRRAEYPPHDS